MANMQTLDNLLMNGHISLEQYLDRLPNGYISKKQELISEVQAKAQQEAAAAAAVSGGTGIARDNVNEMPIPTGPGNGALQRALNRTGVQ